MVIVDVSNLKLKNHIQKKLPSSEVISKLLFIYMADRLFEYKKSKKKYMRLGFFLLEKEGKSDKFGNKRYKCKVRIPKSSLEEGGILSRILDLYGEIRSGRRSDVDAIEELLKMRLELFA